MWECPSCKRKFEKVEQTHTCATKSLDDHFRGKDLAREIFDALVAKIKAEIGPVEIVSIPCCVHLYGHYDFLAALPRRDHLEVRFALPRVISGSRLKASVPVSAHSYKNCVDLRSVGEIDSELLGWITEAYHLKDPD